MDYNATLSNIVHLMKVLVTGGAGYIGSITLKRMLRDGIDVVALDNLSTGHKDAVCCPLLVVDLTKKNNLFRILKNKKFDAVIHFAASALAGESMTNPEKYFYNNILGGLNLLDIMKENSIPNIIFSSSCSIYGKPITLPVIESSPKQPVSVYGETKLMFENILSWYSKIYGIKYINLRYFNAAGASIDGKYGERHEPETHIIPLAIRAAQTGKPFMLFGNNYNTLDGTCVRDYIHVEDLATAHIKALQSLTDGGPSDSYNIGTGRGFSNLEVIKCIQKISGQKVNIKYLPKRAGDPPIIYADSRKAKKKLGFIPQYSDLKTIIGTALKWHQR